MSHTAEPILDPALDALEQAHAETTAAIARAAGEVTRLTAMLNAATEAVAAAEKRAVDAIAEPSADGAADDMVMNAVATARTRRDAAASALRRATAAEEDARALLAPIAQRRERVEAQRRLEALAPALADIDTAITLLGKAMPIVEKLYRTGMYELVHTFTWPENTPVPEPPALVLEERIRSGLFKQLGRLPFTRNGPVIDFKEGSVSAGVTSLVENFSARLHEVEQWRQEGASV